MLSGYADPDARVDAGADVMLRLQSFGEGVGPLGPTSPIPPRVDAGADVMLRLQSLGEESAHSAQRPPFRPELIAVGALEPRAR